MNHDLRTPVPTIYGSLKEKYRPVWEQQIEVLKKSCGQMIEEIRHPDQHLVDVPVIYVKAAQNIEFLREMKTNNDLGYNFLSDLTAIDETPSTPRFEVVYNLFSTENFARIRVKLKVNENEEVESATALWKGASWLEREVYDMFGIRFKNHPDLRRILMDERWKGHPLRKDYPLKGYQFYPSPMAPKEELLKGD